MKKTLYIFASLSAVLFASCAKEIEVKEEPVDDQVVTGTTLRATVEGVDTKVSANAVGVYNWQASDKIAVLDDAGYVYEFTAASAGATSEFNCASSITLGSYAAYPYSASFAASGDAVTFVIPSTITYSADATNMPILGKISGDVVTFKAVGGLLKLIVYGVPSGSTQLEFAAKAQKVSGNFAIADASVESPVIATTTKGESDNIITINYSGKYTSNMVFYIPLPTGTIEGFDLTFNDTGSTTKSVSKELTVERNGIILAPTLNMFTPSTLFSETFTTDIAGSGTPASTTVSAYNAEKKGQTVAGGATVDYSINSIEGTKVYVNENLAKGAAAGELLLGAKVSSTNGEFYITGIPSLGNSNATLTFVANNNTASRSAVSSPTDGVSVFSRTTTGSAAPYTISYSISIASGVNSFDITFTNSTGSNVRIDDITVSSAAPAPTISFTGTGSRTIGVGSLTASDVTGVTLTGALDGTGVGVTTNEDWLEASLSGTTLTITANEYNHGEVDRDAKVFLKATGATTKEITVTQKPSIVSSPNFTITPGDKTFSISWTPDDKAEDYVAYYSTTDNMSDPTKGTALTIITSSTPYTAAPSAELSNGTPYYVYVKVNSVKDAYSAVYVPSSTWVKKSATPTAGGGASLDYTEDFSSKTVGGSSSYASDTWSGSSSTSWTATYCSTEIGTISTNGLNIAIGKSSKSGSISFTGANGITALSFDYKAQGNGLTMRVVVKSGSTTVYTEDTVLSSGDTGSVSIGTSDFSAACGGSFTVTISNQTDKNSLQLGEISWTAAK